MPLCWVNDGPLNTVESKINTTNWSSRELGPHVLFSPAPSVFIYLDIAHFQIPWGLCMMTSIVPIWGFHFLELLDFHWWPIRGNWKWSVKDKGIDTVEPVYRIIISLLDHFTPLDLCLKAESKYAEIGVMDQRVYIWSKTCMFALIITETMTLP